MAEFGSYTFGATPAKVIRAATRDEDFKMVIRPRSEVDVVDRAFRRGKFRHSRWDGLIAVIVPTEMNRFLDALMREHDDEETAWSLRSNILEIMGIEEI